MLMYKALNCLYVQGINVQGIKFFTKFLNKTRQFLMKIKKGNQEFFYVI